MKRRPKINFEILDISNGAELVYVKDSSVKCVVCDTNKVIYKGERMSLTRLYADLRGKDSTESINGYQYFEYNGERLTKRRKRLENS